MRPEDYKYWEDGLVRTAEQLAAERRERKRGLLKRQ